MTFAQRRAAFEFNCPDATAQMLSRADTAADLVSLRHRACGIHHRRQRLRQARHLCGDLPGPAGLDLLRRRWPRRHPVRPAREPRSSRLRPGSAPRRCAWKCAGFSVSPLARSASSSVVQRLACDQMCSRSQSNTGARSPAAMRASRSGMRAAHGGEPLRGVHRAQRVAREIAEHRLRSSARPAAGRRGSCRACRCPAAPSSCVPQRRDVLGLDLAFDQRAARSRSAG